MLCVILQHCKKNCLHEGLISCSVLNRCFTEAFGMKISVCSCKGWKWSSSLPLSFSSTSPLHLLLMWSFHWADRLKFLPPQVYCHFQASQLLPQYNTYGSVNHSYKCFTAAGNWKQGKVFTFLLWFLLFWAASKELPCGGWIRPVPCAAREEGWKRGRGGALEHFIKHSRL